MPKYFFRLRGRHKFVVVRDPTGRDYIDLAQAHDEAVAIIRKVAISRGQPPILNFTLEITDHLGAIVLSLPFADALLNLPALTAGAPKLAGTVH